MPHWAIRAKTVHPPSRLLSPPISPRSSPCQPTNASSVPTLDFALGYGCLIYPTTRWQTNHPRSYHFTTKIPIDGLDASGISRSKKLACGTILSELHHLPLGRLGCLSRAFDLRCHYSERLCECNCSASQVGVYANSYTDTSS